MVKYGIIKNKVTQAYWGKNEVFKKVIDISNVFMYDFSIWIWNKF